MPTRRGAVLLVLCAVLAGCGPAAPEAAPRPARTPPPASSSAAVPTRSFTLLATGDVLINQDRDLPVAARRPDGSYDFSGVLAPVASLVQAADVAVCHLETPVAPAGGPFRDYPSFAVQPQIVAALAGAGFDECSTASNHSMDAGFDGIVRTLDTLDAAGIRHVGTARSQGEDQQPDVLDVRGVRVGFVAGTFSLNGVPLPAGRPWAVDVADVPDVDGMLGAAARARAAGAQVVVASLHCCLEYDPVPTAAQEEAVHRLLASPDVDLVLGHHAHVVQPFELVDGKWAAYGLGNFVAELVRRGPTYDSVAARFTFTQRPDGHVAVTRAQAVPLHIDVHPGVVQVVPADPAAFGRVAAVLDARGAVAAGLEIVPG